MNEKEINTNNTTDTEISSDNTPVDKLTEKQVPENDPADSDINNTSIESVHGSEIHEHRTTSIKPFLILYSLLTVSVILSFSTAFDEAFVTPKRFFLHLFTILIVIFWVKNTLNRQWRWKGILPIVTAVFYSSIVLISNIFSIHPASGTEFIIDASAYLVLFLVAAEIFQPEDISKLIRWIFLAGAVVAVYSILQHLGLDPVKWIQYDLVRTRTISTMGNPDFLSAILSMIIPLVLVHAFMKDESGKTNTGFLSISFCAFLCFVNIWTYTRAGLVSMTTGILCALILAGKRTISENKRKILALVILLLLAFLAVKTLEMTGHSQLQLADRTKAFTDHTEINVSTRIALWKAAGKIFLENPIIGTGPETFNITYLKYRYLEPQQIHYRVALPGSPHNMLLEIAASSGILGILGFLAFIGSLIYVGIKYFKQSTGKVESPEKDNIRLIAAGCAAVITSYITHHMAGFSTQPTKLLFWLIAACSVVIFSSGIPDCDTPTQNYRKISSVKLALLIALILGGGLLMIRTGKQTLADYYFARGRKLQDYLTARLDDKQKLEVFTRANTYYEKAKTLTPYNPRYHLNHGKLHEIYSRMNQEPQYIRELVINSAISYETAINLDPGNPYPYADLARLLGVWGQFEPAQVFQEKAVSLDPYNTTLMFDLSRLYIRMGKPQNAEEVLKKGIDISPGSDTWTALGIFYLNRKSYRQAEDSFKKALDHKPGNWAIIRYLLRIVKEESKNQNESIK